MRIDKEQLKQIILKEIKQNLSEQAQKKVYVKTSYASLRAGAGSGEKAIPPCKGIDKTKHVRCLAYGDELVVSAAAAPGFDKVIKHTRAGKDIAHEGTWYVATTHVSTKLQSRADKLASLATGTAPAVYPGEASFTSGARG